MSEELRLTDQDKQLLLSLARTAIENALSSRSRSLPPRSNALNVKAGAFVTLRVPAEDGRLRLRGCIGHIVAADGLYETVRDAAVSSALSDPRFPPVDASELASVAIEISVLSPFRVIFDVSEIEPGRHGLFIRRGHASGLLLPQVATEQGWDRETFVRHTCLKAGLPPGCEDQEGVELSVFTAEVFDESQPDV